jgi:hypothetical protein
MSHFQKCPVCETRHANDLQCPDFESDPAGVEHRKPREILADAAPEMLEALKATIDYLELFATPEANELWGKVGSAIAKATGVSR